jgi:enoyl-CoA hydratase/carnithine racemase
MAYDYQWILCEKVEKVLKITLNRPEILNALDDAVEKELHDALDEGDLDPDVGCMVLTGAGDSFSAGYNMAVGPEEKSPLDPTRFTSVGDFLEYWQVFDYENVQYKQLHFFRLKKPVIAAVHGYCMGGGMWIAMACDMTYCSDDAVFGQPEVRHNSNATFLIPALCGWKHASRWLLTGDHFNGKEALRIGIVNDCVPRDQLMPTVMDVAGRIAKVPHHSVRCMKRMIMSGFLSFGLAAALELCSAMSAFGHTSHGPERQAMFDAQAKDGFKAFLQMRDGPFQPEPMGPKSKLKK